MQLAAFNGIFLNDFTSSITANLFGQAGSYGPIAVGNNLYAPGYLVAEKTNLTACTPDTSGFAQYGLAVGGSIINGGTPKVTGNVYVSGTGTATLQLPSCSVRKLIDSQQFDFAAAKTSYLQASEHLAKLIPNLRLNSTFALSSLGPQADLLYNVITLNTCNGPILGCFGASFTGNLTGLLSTAGVPVVVGTTLVIDSDTPSVGIDPCRTIWNIYAVNIDGSHTNGPIILSRNTRSSLQGFILAPNAAVLDGPTGNFAGLLVSNNYNIIILSIFIFSVVAASFVVRHLKVKLTSSTAASSPSVEQACDLSKSLDLPSLQLAAFNGIFLNDFTSSITANLFGQAGSYGPIAVGNNLYAPGYLVAEKTNLTACTPNASGFAQYGLAVGGSIINGGTPKVTGNVYVSGTGTATLQLPSCSVRKLIDSQQFDFAAAKISYLQASERLAKLTPNLRMNSTFGLSSLGTQADPQYNVITLNTCLGPILGCFGASFTGNLTGLLSTAGVITNLSGYKGPTAGTKWPSGGTLVINVPVAVGAALEIDSDTPSIGTDPCRTIWNIYAVNIDGSHTNGPITLSRNTKLSLQGFILAPNGNFAGLLVSNNYNWQTSNVNILDFSTASGGICKSYLGCVPNQNATTTSMLSSLSVSKTVSSSSVTASTTASSPSVTQACDLSKSIDLPSLQLSAFNGIFLNDFTSSITANLFGTSGSYGPIAVGNNLYAPGYLIAEKTNLTSCTPNASGFSQYGLAVGGSIINGGTPKVTGNVYVAGTGTATLQLPSCSVRKLIDSQQFDFAAAKISYLQASEHLAKLVPNLRLDISFSLSSLGTQADPQYNVITLNTCNGPILGCFGASFTGNLTGLLSTAGVITNLSGYKGPTAGTKWPSGATLVINFSFKVPVLLGATLVIDSDTPSVGIDPSAVLDGPTGNFAGLLVSNNYNKTGSSIPVYPHCDFTALTSFYIEISTHSIIILDIVNHRSIFLGIVIHIPFIFCTVIGYLKFRCSLDINLQLAAFNGIFLNDFTSSITANLFGQAGSYGPIAVGNNLYAPGYLVAEKTNLTACTPNTSGFAQYGLAVGGSIINGGTPKVTGNVYVSGTGTATLQLPSCSVRKLIDSQQFDFAAAKISYLQASEYLAKLTPNLRMNSTFGLSSLGTQADPQYNVITLNTCLGPILGCFGASFTGNLTGLLSTAGVITNLSGYKGPTAGTKWPSGGTLVINVPVAVGAALEIDSDTPSIGTDPCRTIWNIYAVNIDGSHTNGPITLSRNTKLSLQGFILAPNGNFAGLLVSNNYNVVILVVIDYSIVIIDIVIQSIVIFSVVITSFIIGHLKVELTSSTAASSPSVEQACDLSKSLDLPSLQLAAFNGIFLNDFTSSITANLFGPAGSYGPIAVGNNLYAPGYLVAEKTNLTACTLNASGFAQYGLAVGGSIINGGTPKVTGNVYVSGTGTATLQLPSCSVRKLIDSQQFDFAAAKTSYLQASEHLAKLTPNLRLNSTFALSTLGAQADPLYNVITLNTCLGPILGCFGASFNGNLTGLLSTAGVIADLSGYKGPTAGTKWPSGATLVINVPVVVGTTLVINSDTPSVGTDPCRTIWNIYAVNIDGSHTNGPIILSRNTRQSLQGLILAPNAAVLDGPTGNFAGLLVSNNYNKTGSSIPVYPHCDFTALTSFYIEISTHSIIILDIVNHRSIFLGIVIHIPFIFCTVIGYLKFRCSLDINLQLAAFNGIFLNDFTSSITANLFGQAGSYGPIAVGNNLYAPGYLVAEKTNLTACTPNASGFAQYGLAVGGSIINGGTPKVTGNVYVSGTGTATLQLPSCSVRKLIDSQQFDFAAAKISYLQASEYLAKLTPNLRMNSTFALSSFGTQADPQYNVITLNTCLGPILGCFGASFNGNLTGLLSTAGVITDLSGYKGPTAGTKWPSGATLVINVPVGVGAILEINSDTPSIGTDPCRTIWNIYPVNIDGSHTNGPITLSRNTKLSLQGFILAPNAAVLDGPTGNFAGLLVSNNYNIIELSYFDVLTSFCIVIATHSSIILDIVDHRIVFLSIVTQVVAIFGLANLGNVILGIVIHGLAILDIVICNAIVKHL
ncbi:hypothetical protein BC943DRAFT_340283 [Umbelopsis sp. AD052]|nr:hypothetical protein BC943DRAFT_340283 [Umbelopsis sp. AD052]